MHSSVKKFISLVTTLLLALSGTVLMASPAQANVVLNANGVSLKFDEGVQTRNVISGPTGASTMGKAAGNIVVYRNVATISSTVVDAVIETVSVTSASITAYDGGNAVTGGSSDEYFQSDINTTNAGSVVYKFSFFVGGTYTAINTGTPVILQNVYINSYDLDQSQAGNNQYTQFSGVQAYTLSTNTTIGVSASGNLLQFINTADPANYSASDGSYTKGRVQVKYDNLSSISIKVGTDNAASGGTNYYALDFSVGLPWTQGSATTYQGATVINSFNSPPTSTNDTETVTAQTATFLTSADFGTYADPDVNPWVSVRIDSLPSGGTLQWFNGTSWIGVTGNQVISVSDLNANRLRYTSNAQTTSDSLTFRVSDGLLNSVSAYTLAITVTGGSQALTAQAITFAQPASQVMSSGALTVAPTADSGLTVSLASTTTGVCTVSGFVVTFVSIGNCSLTASQAGDSTYSAATNVVRSFAITNPQTITFAQPADQLLSAASLTVAPTASSALAVTLTATTPGVCSVTGFVVSFLTNGVCSLTSSQPGNATFSPAVDVSRSFNISTPGVNPPALPDAPDIDPISGKGDGSTPITLAVPINRGTGGSSCLIDPADLICKQTVTVRGKGTFTLSPDGKTTFTAVPGFFGALTVQYRVTDGYGRFDLAPVTVEIVNPNPTAETAGTSQNGTTTGVSPVVLTPATPLPRGGQLCLIDPADSVCKTVVRVAGVGTWTQARDGSVRFVAIEGYIGSTTVMQRFTRASLAPKLTPFTVSVAKSRGPVTVTISGFADGSPVLTAAIRARINAFLRAHADYKNVYCIGYTEGPTVLPTDAALSRQRAVNGCAFVKSGLGKQLTLKQLTASQGTVEAAKFRRITITLTD
jgi:hypothetical protein